MLILWITNLKNFETSDIQHTDVIVPLGLGVKSLVDSLDQPAEHTVVQRLSQGTDGVDDLLFVLSLDDKLGSDLDLRLEQAFKEVSSVDTQQESNLFGLCKR